jgi:hypothetical protein
VAEREHEKGVGKKARQHGRDENVSRVGITERGAAFLLRRADDEVDRVLLHLLRVCKEVRLPILWHEAGQWAAELDGQRPVGEVQGAVFTDVED